MSEYDYSGLPAEEALALAQEVAISRHPEAAPFKDLLAGPNLASVEALAKDIAERVRAGQQVDVREHEGEPAHQGEDDGEAETSVPTVVSALERMRSGDDSGTAMADYIEAKLAEASQ